MMLRNAERPSKGHKIVLTLAFVFLAGCSLPKPDGTEAEIAAKAAVLTPLSQDVAGQPQTVSRNAVLINPSVREAASLVNVSAAEVRVQRAAIFPSLSLSLDGGIGDAGRSETNIDLTGRQLFLGLGAAERAVTVADVELQINYHSFQQSVDTAITDALEASDAVNKHTLVLEVWRTQLYVMRELQSMVSERNDIGAAPISDVLETRKRLQAAQFLVHDTELLLAEAKDRLTRLSGQSAAVQTPIVTNGSCSSQENADEVILARLQLTKLQ